MVPEAASPRILIARMSSIRGTVLTLPVAGALRDRYPHAYIAWAVERNAAPVVSKHRAIDETIPLERGWQHSAKRLHAFRRLLRSRAFDISIDCEGVTKTALAGWMAGAGQRLGFRGRHGRELSQALNNTLVQPVFNHLTDRTLELLIPLQIHSPSLRWNLPISEAARTWADRWARSLPGHRLAVFHPGATWESKWWDCGRYGEVANYIQQRYNYRTVVSWGNETERQLAQLVVLRSKGAATLAPDTDLTHLAALIERANLFLGVDSAPLHLSAAVSTPSIGLFGATQPGNTGPYGQVAIAASYQGGSRRQRRRAANAAMMKIGVEQVCEAIDDMESKRMIRAAA